MFKVNNRNIRTRCEICTELTIKTPERRQWRRSAVLIVNFEHTSHLALVLLYVNADWVLTIFKKKEKSVWGNLEMFSVFWWAIRLISLQCIGRSGTNFFKKKLAKSNMLLKLVHTLRHTLSHAWWRCAKNEFQIPLRWVLDQNLLRAPA